MAFYQRWNEEMEEQSQRVFNADMEGRKEGRKRITDLVQELD